MSNIEVRKNELPSAISRAGRHWDPARLMRSMLSWDPFREMMPYEIEATMGTYAFEPSFEVKETKDAYLFKADVPGVKQGDLDIALSGNRLSISGKREAEKQEKTDAYYAYERSYGSFTRAFTMPDDIDGGAVHADLRDGVLTVSVGKKPEAQPKKIPVSTAHATKS